MLGWEPFKAMYRVDDHVPCRLYKRPSDSSISTAAPSAARVLNFILDC